MPRRRRHLLVLLPTFWLGFALRFFALGAKSFWYDEMRQVEIAQLPLERMAEALLLHAARPLDYWITHYTLMLGQQEFWLRSPAALLGTLTLAVFYFLARRWLGVAGGVVAAVLLAVSPIHVGFSQELRPYVVYALAAVSSYACLGMAVWEGAGSGERGAGSRLQRAEPGAADRVSNDVGYVFSSEARLLPSLDFPTAPCSPLPAPPLSPRMYWLGYFLCLCVGLLSHYFFVFVIAGQVLWIGLLWIGRAINRRRVVAAGASWAAAGLVLLLTADPLTVLPYAAQFGSALATGSSALGGAPAGPARVAPEVTWDFATSHVLAFLGSGGGAALWLYGGLALVGLASLLARRQWAWAAGLVTWLLAGPALIVAYLVYRNALYGNRYLLFAVPAYLLLVAEGLVALGRVVGQRAGGHIGTPVRRWAYPAVAAAVFAAVLVPQLWRLYVTPKDDWRRVGAFLRANVRPGDVIFAPDVQAFVRFYYPEGSSQLSCANGLDEIYAALNPAPRAWFVISQYTLKDMSYVKDEIAFLPSAVISLDPVIEVRYFRKHAGPLQAQQDAAQFVIPPRSLPYEVPEQ